MEIIDLFNNSTITNQLFDFPPIDRSVGGILQGKPLICGGNGPSQESFEIEVISAYMPSALPEEEIDNLISGAIAATGATHMKDMGKIMGNLIPAIKGRADMRAVSEKVKPHLT